MPSWQCCSTAVATAVTHAICLDSCYLQTQADYRGSVQQLFEPTALDQRPGLEVPRASVRVRPLFTRYSNQCIDVWHPFNGDRPSRQYAPSGVVHPRGHQQLAHAGRLQGKRCKLCLMPAMYCCCVCSKP